MLGNALETALQKINREDVVKKCMYDTEVVDDEVEAAAARVAMDQSGQLSTSFHVLSSLPYCRIFVD